MEYLHDFIRLIFSRIGRRVAWLVVAVYLQLYGQSKRSWRDKR